MEEKRQVQSGRFAEPEVDEAGGTATLLTRLGEREMAYQYALNRLFVVTANLGTLFENVSDLPDPAGPATRPGICGSTDCLVESLGCFKS